MVQCGSSRGGGLPSNTILKEGGDRGKSHLKHYPYMLRTAFLF